jgi:hypothetical protein
MSHFVVHDRYCTNASTDLTAVHERLLTQVARLLALSADDAKAHTTAVREAIIAHSVKGGSSKSDKKAADYSKSFGGTKVQLLPYRLLRVLLFRKDTCLQTSVWILHST